MHAICNKKFVLLLLALSLAFGQQPILKIISPIENDPIITTGKTTIFGELKRADNLYINNNKVTIEKGLFRIIIPEQQPGKKVYRLVARNNEYSTQKDLNVITLQTLLDTYLSPFKKEIEILLTMKVMGSYLGTDFFRPDTFITKAEVVHTLIKLHKIDPLDYRTKYYFKDLLPNHWAYEYIQTALNKKLIEPKEAGLFGTESFLSRKEIILLLKPLMSVQTTEQLKPFVDINYNQADEKLLSDVAIAGYLPKEWTNRKEIYPNRAVTRGEIAYIISRTDTLRKRIKDTLSIGLDLSPIKTNLGQTAKSIDISFFPITKQTFKITGISNTDRKIIYIELTFSDNYHTKNILLADDGKGLDKIKGDNLFTSAVDLSKFNKSDLSYEYKMFNAFNLIEEAGKGKINYSNGNLSVN
jgi:hypothetical protein